MKNRNFENDDLEFVGGEEIPSENPTDEEVEAPEGMKPDFGVDLKTGQVKDPIEVDEEKEEDAGMGMGALGDEEFQPMGNFIEYTIGNKLNQASQGTTLERIWAYKDILILLGQFIKEIEEFKPMMSMKQSLDELMKQSGFRFGTSYKKLIFIRDKSYKTYAEEKYLQELENLVMRAMRLARDEGIINLQEAASGYNMVVFDQGGGFRPQPKRQY